MHLPAVSCRRSGSAAPAAQTAGAWNGAPAALPQRPNQRWSKDFVSDCTAGGRTIRTLTLVEDYTRECLAIEVDNALGGVRPSARSFRVASGPDILENS